MALTRTPHRASTALQKHGLSSLEDTDSGHDSVELRVSTETEDSDWDDFLESTPQGHFQQSGAWAQYKAEEGWSVIRAVYTLDDSIVGGCQMLWKNTKLGRLAYVSKGPVLHRHVDHLAKRATALIKRVAVESGFTAVIVQPPDECASVLRRTATQEEFIPCSFLGIIESTLLVDLSRGVSALVQGYRGSTRNKRSKAIRSGMTVRDGDERHTPDFFRLMRMTCKRQGVHPNPPTEESLRALLRSLNARRTRAHYKFTCFHGEVVAGDLIIVFGRRATLFKTGWNGRHPKLHPNCLRVCDAIEWASSEHCDLFDFAAFGKELAEPLLQGEKVAPELSKHRDSFKAGFGGYPKLLPGAGLWVPHPFLRLCVRHATGVPLVRNAIKRVVR